MAYRYFTDFLQDLERRGWLDTIQAEVDPILEITEITDRISKANGKGLLFKNVKGSRYPLAINTMGSYDRLSLGLGVGHPDEIAVQIADFLDLGAYATLWDKIKAIPKLAPLAFIFPRKVSHGACQEVVEEPDLSTLPILQCWPDDGGRYITLPLVFTRDPETGQQNVGMYRMQVYDSRTTGMHWHLHKDGRAIYDKYRALGRKMPVAVALGCDPAVIYSATAPLPKMIDEMIFAGFLRKKPVDMVQCITSELMVPANAEFILEGYVDLDEQRLEGPFGDHTGYYSLQDNYPVFHLEKITRRTHPVYPTTIVGKPPMEDCFLGKATERIFLPLLALQCPEVVDMNLPLEGVFHNCAILSIRKAFPLHAQKVMYALWGLGQMMYTKLLILVDDSVDVQNLEQVSEAVLTHATARNHFILTEGPLDALDHASDRAFQGYRLGIDATVKLPSEEGSPATPDKPIRAILDALLEEKDDAVFIRHLDKTAGKNARDLFTQHLRLHPTLRWLILVDPSVDPTDLSTVAWKVFNNIDAKRDIQWHTRSDGNLVIAIDATKKGPEDGHLRLWPDDIEMSPAIKALVDERWDTYGLSQD